MLYRPGHNTTWCCQIFQQFNAFTHASRLQSKDWKFQARTELNFWAQLDPVTGGVRPSPAAASHEFFERAGQ